MLAVDLALRWQDASRRRHFFAESGTAKPQRVTDAGRATYEIVRGQKGDKTNETTCRRSAGRRTGATGTAATRTAYARVSRVRTMDL